MVRLPCGAMRRRIRVIELADVFERIRRQADLPMVFPEPVEEEAGAVTPDTSEHEDLRSVPFVTVDPPDAMDLDQAIALEALEGGAIRLRYAIVDLSAFVVAGGEIDREARKRGQTVYCPDRAVPLHPETLSERNASLLPGEDRPAVVFEIDVEADGAPRRFDIRRAIVRSRRRYDYRTLQDLFDTGSPPEPLALLGAFGEARLERGVERGALTLRLPEQHAVENEGRWTLTCRSDLAVERWNAEVSLLTGMVAADLMLEHGVGILRTLPAPDVDAIGRLRGAAKALGVAWSRDVSPAELLASLDPGRPRQMALFVAATLLLRGAGYRGFRDGVPPDEDLGHGGLASQYAHVTAPLRRLVDRYTLATCTALAAGRAVPGWVEEAVGEIPEVMAETEGRASGVERKCVNAAEAWVMGGRTGERFEAAVLDADGRGSQIWIDEPPILAWAEDVRAKSGQVIEVVVDDTDVIRGMIAFSRTD